MDIGKESVVEVRGCFEGVKGREGFGSGVIELKALESKGEVQVQLVQNNGSRVGTVYCKYSMAAVSSFPVLVMKNVRCEFEKKIEKIGKANLAVRCAGNVISVQGKNTNNQQYLEWKDSVRINVKEREIIVFSVEDGGDRNRLILTYQANCQQFKSKGIQKYYVRDSSFELLGILEFEYETNDLFSEKNDEEAKSDKNEHNQISFESIRCNFDKSGFDFYLKVLVGGNVVKSSIVKKYHKDFLIDIKQVLYIDGADKQMLFVTYDGESEKDGYQGRGKLVLKEIDSGNITVRLQSRDGSYVGELIVSAVVKKVPRRQLRLTNICVRNKNNSGLKSMFVLGCVGCWVSHTELIPPEKQIIFSRQLFFVFSDEKKLLIRIIDEEEQNLYEMEEVELKDFKESGEMRLTLKSEKEKNGHDGELTFRYTTTNGIYRQKSSKEGESVLELQKDQQHQAKSVPNQQKRNTEKGQPITQQKQSQKEGAQNKQEGNVQENQTEKSNMDIQQDGRKGTNSSKKNVDQKEDNQKQKKVGKKDGESKMYEGRKSSKVEESNKKQSKRSSNNELGSSETQTKKQQKPLKKQKKQPSKDHPQNTGQSIKFPAIQSRNYGDKIYQKQSSATLQKSIHVFSIPKATRFGSNQKYSGQPNFYIDSCFKYQPNKGTGFGYGTKKQFPQWMQRNMKQYPAPGAYFDQFGSEGMNQFRMKGKTFGLSHKYYEKVTIPKQKINYESTGRKSPQKIFLPRR